MKLELDTAKEGLYTLFKPYQASLLEHIWKLNENERTAIGSGKAHEFIQTTDDKKSRASVIFFLNDMVDEGVLGFDDATGKGGHHKKYWPKMTPMDFAHHVEDKVGSKVAELVDMCKTLG